MPKWGLSMQEGAIVEWWKGEGDIVSEGDDLVDIETAKITNVAESPAAGVLRRIVAGSGETLPVGALIGVVADASVSDAEIDAFVTEFQTTFVVSDADAEDGGALKLSSVNVPGGTIQIGKTGLEDGTPIVLLHGYSGDLNSWLFNIEGLAALGPVIALDLPGHGGSSKTVGDGSLGTLAASVSAALSAAGVESAHLIGHSLGAALAARIAIDKPGLAKSLTLISPAGFPGTAVSEAFLTGVIDASRAKDLKPVLEMLLASPEGVTKAMIDDMLKFKRTDGVEEALAAIRDRLVDGADAKALKAELAAIPTALVIASRTDQIIGVVDEAALPPGFRVVWIADAGHMAHLEQAAQVNALLVRQVTG
jgi:pyruvate dehydrogenase E2 component (dihydrolipoamide acetyltransferase)